MHQTQRKSVCLPPVTKSVQVTWYKQAKGVQLEKMHRASTKRKSVSASKIVKGRAPVNTRAKRPPTGVHPAGLTVGVSIYDEGAPCHQASKPSYMLTLPQLWPTKTPDRTVRGLQMAVAKGPSWKGCVRSYPCYEGCLQGR